MSHILPNHDTPQLKVIDTYLKSLATFDFTVLKTLTTDDFLMIMAPASMNVPDKTKTEDLAFLEELKMLLNGQHLEAKLETLNTEVVYLFKFGTGIRTNKVVQVIEFPDSKRRVPENGGPAAHQAWQLFGQRSIFNLNDEQSDLTGLASEWYPHATDKIIAKIMKIYGIYRLQDSEKTNILPGDYFAGCCWRAAVPQLPLHLILPSSICHISPNCMGTPCPPASPVRTISDLGCFNVDPGRRLNAQDGHANPKPRRAIDRFLRNTRFSMRVSGDVFLSYITVHPFPTSTSDTPYSDHAACRGGAAGGMGPGPHRDGPDDGAESIRTKPESFCRNEPHILLDKGILRITDCDLHHVARALAAAQGHGAVIPAAEEEKGPTEARLLLYTPWPRCRTTQVQALAQALRYSYVEKDMPLPEELRSDHVRCMLGEDVVLLFECPAGGPENAAQRIRIEKIYYHPPIGLGFRCAAVVVAVWFPLLHRTVFKFGEGFILTRKQHAGTPKSVKARFGNHQASTTMDTSCFA
ncbi:hypothetical protein V8E52_009576 [Russula decolorans]